VKFKLLKPVQKLQFAFFKISCNNITDGPDKLAKYREANDDVEREWNITIFERH